jgi:hypothetical protein
MSLHRVFAASELPGLIEARTAPSRRKITIKKQRPTKSCNKTSTVKLSTRKEKPKGCSEGKKHVEKIYHAGPITIEDVMREGPSHHKSETADP